MKYIGHVDFVLKNVFIKGIFVTFYFNWMISLFLPFLGSAKELDFWIPHHKKQKLRQVWQVCWKFNNDLVSRKSRIISHISKGTVNEILSMLFSQTKSYSGTMPNFISFTFVENLKVFFFISTMNMTMFLLLMQFFFYLSLANSFFTSFEIS